MFGKSVRLVSKLSRLYYILSIKYFSALHQSILAAFNNKLSQYWYYNW